MKKRIRDSKGRPIAPPGPVFYDFAAAPSLGQLSILPDIAPGEPISPKTEVVCVERKPKDRQHNTLVAKQEAMSMEAQLAVLKDGLARCGEEIRKSRQKEIDAAVTVRLSEELTRRTCKHCSWMRADTGMDYCGHPDIEILAPDQSRGIRVKHRLTVRPDFGCIKFEAKAGGAP